MSWVRGKSHGAETVPKTAKFPHLQVNVGPRQFLDKIVFMPVACRHLGSAVLDKVDMSVVAMTGAFGFTVQKTVEVPQLQSVQFLASC